MPTATWACAVVAANGTIKSAANKTRRKLFMTFLPVPPRLLVPTWGPGGYPPSRARRRRVFSSSGIHSYEHGLRIKLRSRDRNCAANQPCNSLLLSEEQLRPLLVKKTAPPGGEAARFDSYR